jgi:hypothetical protein
VKFDINYTVSGPDITLSQSFVNVDDIKKESKLIEVTWEDGQKLDIYVKATDLIGENTIDTIVIYVFLNSLSKLVKVKGTSYTTIIKLMSTF